MYEGHTHNQQKVNVWAGILNFEAIIGPFFIESNLNANNYLAMLQDEIVPAIRSLVKTSMTFGSSKKRRHLTTVYEYANI